MKEIDPGLTGPKIFEELERCLTGAASSEAQTNLNTFAHTQMLWIHSRALVCHCECLDMNAENMWAAIANAKPAYKSEDYYAIMEKWDLINEKGEPTI